MIILEVLDISDEAQVARVDAIERVEEKHYERNKQIDHPHKINADIFTPSSLELACFMIYCRILLD